MEKYIFYFVDSNGSDIKISTYEFSNMEEAATHARKLLAVDSSDTDHIEISNNLFTRVKVYYGN